MQWRSMASRVENTVFSGRPKLPPQAAQLVDVAVQHPYVGAHAERDMDGVGSDDAAADDDNFSGIDAGHAAQQDAQAVMGLLQVIGACLDRHAAGHFPTSARAAASRRTAR